MRKENKKKREGMKRKLLLGQKYTEPITPNLAW